MAGKSVVNILMLELVFLMTTPRTPLSEIRVFEPPPKIVSWS